MLYVLDILPRFCNIKANALTKQADFVSYYKDVTHSYDKILNVTILCVLSRFFPLVSEALVMNTKFRAPVKCTEPETIGKVQEQYFNKLMGGSIVIQNLEISSLWQQFQTSPSNQIFWRHC